MMSEQITQKPSRLNIRLSSALLCASAAALGSSTVSADSIDFSLSDSTARGEYQGQFVQRKDLRYGGHFVYHEDDGHVAGLSLHVAGRSKATTLSQHTGIGAKLVQYDAGDPNGGSIAVGGYILHNLAAANLLSVRGDIYYAPSVVSFGDGERYFEFSLRMEYKVVNQASVYLGYRNIEADFKGFGDKDIEESGNVGLIMHF